LIRCAYRLEATAKLIAVGLLESAVVALDHALWIDLPEERHDVFLTRGGEAENQLEEMVLIWNRIGDDRIQEIEARHRFYDEQERLGVSNVTLGDARTPDATGPASGEYAHFCRFERAL
jgi:hypothetical protein